MVVRVIKRPHLRVRALLNNDQQATRNNQHRTRPPKVKDAVHKNYLQQGHKNDKGGQSQDKGTEKVPLRARGGWSQKDAGARRWRKAKRLTEP